MVFKERKQYAFLNLEGSHWNRTGSKLTSFCSQTWLLLLVCLGNMVNMLFTLGGSEGHVCITCWIFYKTSYLYTVLKDCKGTYGSMTLFFFVHVLSSLYMNTGHTHSPNLESVYWFQIIFFHFFAVLLNLVSVHNHSYTESQLTLYFVNVNITSIEW